MAPLRALQEPRRGVRIATFIVQVIGNCDLFYPSPRNNVGTVKIFALAGSKSGFARYVPRDPAKVKHVLDFSKEGRVS
jgi:hypothetical protein